DADLPARGVFCGKNGETSPEAPHSRRILLPPSEKKGAASKPADKRYTTKDVFLRPGDYRVKVAAGSYVWWKTFSVQDEAVTIPCDFLKGKRRPLAVKPHAYDAATGREITDKAAVSVLLNGVWTALSDVPENRMTSGAVWKFKFSCAGYADEQFSLLLDWYQDELLISASLAPLN
nr:serine/threonine protein kinase [Treponemataceae bacterium]